MTIEQKPSSFHKLLFFWVFISILPQFLQLTRDDAAGTVLKELSIFLLVVIASFQGLVKKRVLRASRFFGLAVFMVIQVISNFYINSGSGTDEYISIIISLLFYYIFFCQYDKEQISRQQLLSLARMFEYLLLYVCMMNFFLYGKQMIPLLTTYHADVYNIDSVFFNRTNFASFLLVCIIMVSIRLHYHQGNRLFQWGLLLLGAFNMLLTLARTSIFALLVFAIFMFLYKKRDMLMQRMPMLIAIILLISIVLNASGAMGFVIKVVLRPQSGLTHRDSIWGHLLSAFRNAGFSQMLFGLGYRYPLEAHNTILGTIEKFGLLGLGFYLTIYIQTLGSIRRIWQRDRNLGVFFTIVFVTFWATSFTEEFTPFMSSSMSVIWTLVGVLLPKYYANNLEG